MADEPTRHRFLLFAGDNYYPGGGGHDYCGSRATREEADAWLAEATCFDWAHVFDVDAGEIVGSRSS